MKAFVRELALNDVDDLLAKLAATAELDNDEALSRVTAPTLAIGGQLDPLYPPAELEHLAAVIPNATCVIVEGVGHQPHVEAAATVNRLLSKFFARVESAGVSA